MIYKNIFLGTLLVPFAIFSNVDIDARMQELGSSQAEKILKLSDMIDVIIKKQELKTELLSKAVDIAKTAFASLNDDEQKEFKANLEAFENQFTKMVKANAVNHFFMEELFNNKKYNNDLGRIKALLIKIGIESILLQTLVKEYEKCFQEILQIGHELDEIQKQTLNN